LDWCFIEIAVSKREIINSHKIEQHNYVSWACSYSWDYNWRLEQFFPKRDELTKENIKGFDLHNETGRANDTQVETSSPKTVGAEESILNFDNTALLFFKDIIGNIESTNDFRLICST